VANLDITQRNSLERSTLAGSDSLRRGSERGAAIYNLVAIVVAALLSAVAVATIENWSQWLVLGVIVLTTIGFMIALSPNRRG
jgi:hypothetical protein